MCTRSAAHGTSDIFNELGDITSALACLIVEANAGNARVEKKNSDVRDFIEELDNWIKEKEANQDNHELDFTESDNKAVALEEDLDSKKRESLELSDKVIEVLKKKQNDVRANLDVIVGDGVDMEEDRLTD